MSEKMNIKTISGHLTATEKQHIKAILNLKLMAGKIGRKNYNMSKDNDIYTVHINQNDRGLGFIGSELRESTYKNQFILT